MLEQGSDYWLQQYGRYGSLISQYRGYVDGERGGICVLFSQTRQDTQHFVDENGFDKTKKRYQGAEGALGDWKSSLSPAGEKNDADAFSRAVLEKLGLGIIHTERNIIVCRRRNIK